MADDSAVSHHILCTMPAASAIDDSKNNGMFCAVYEVEGPGLDGNMHFCRKPWLLTTAPFLGMVWCLPLAYWEDRVEKAKQRQHAANGDGEGAEQPLLDNQVTEKTSGQARR